MRADLLRIIVRSFLYRDKHARLRIASYVVYLCAIRAGKRGARVHICAIRVQRVNGSNPRSILVLDNASIHHVSKMIELVERRGVMIKFMPAYSPDYMPFQQSRSEIVYTSTDNPSLLDHIDLSIEMTV